MKPLAIIQFKVDDAPAFFTDYMSAQKIPCKIFCMHTGDNVPENISAYSGLCVLGGSMSANDHLPYMPRLYALITDALRQDIPIIGHCLGGQMLAKALGGQVHMMPEPEIGWSTIMPHHNAEALRWFGTLEPFHLYHWHYERFDLPARATLIASTPHCPHQAFSMGKHIAMQFHCEVTAEKIDGWMTRVAEMEVEQLTSIATVQQFNLMGISNKKWIAQSNLIASNIYAEWLRGVKQV